MILAEQSNQTREQIVTAAVELFADKGYHETSMAAIAERAHVGKGTLYWHFQSKDELFKQILTEKGERLFDAIHTLVHQPIPPTEILRELIRIKLNFAAQEKDLSKILLKSVQFADQEFMLKLFQKHRSMISEVEMVFQRGIDAGIFREGSAQLMTVATIGMVNGLTSTFFCTEEEVQVDVLVDSLYNMVLHGIRKP